MSGIKSARESGKRRESRHGGKSLLAPTLGVHTSDLGEHRLNIRQIYALEAMYQTHPAVQAARTVLHSQLLQGGVKLMRNGEDAKPVKFGETNTDGSRKKGITKDFATHLEDNWLPFAKDIIDSFLKWGFCPVVFQEMEEDEHAVALEQLKREVGMVNSGRKDLRKRDRPRALVPHVPQLGTYEVAWSYAGKYGYTRKYLLYNQAPGNVTREDPTAKIFIRQHPDSVGNVNSPLATVYEQGSFVSSLVEMAFTAEMSRSAPSIVTQLRKPEKGTDLSAGALFFDAESRNLAADQDGDESQRAARDLEMQAALCRVINQMQTKGTDRDAMGSSSAAPRFSQPDVQPKLFTLPKACAPPIHPPTHGTVLTARCRTHHPVPPLRSQDHELAPHVQVPQPRGDLEALMRLGIDQFCCALVRATAHSLLPCTCAACLRLHLLHLCMLAGCPGEPGI